MPGPLTEYMELCRMADLIWREYAQTESHARELELMDQLARIEAKKTVIRRVLGGRYV